MATPGEKCIQIYPDRIPIIIHHNNLQKEYLAYRNTSIRYLTSLVRNNFRAKVSESLNLFVGYLQLDSCDIVFDLYVKYKNLIDGYLHISTNQIVHK